MSLPTSIVLSPLNTTELSFGPITDGLNVHAVIVAATVTASLWKTVRGVLTTKLTSAALTIDSTNIYRGLMGGGSFNPPPGQNYVMCVDLVNSGQTAHWEFPTTIVPRTT